jgi:predicted transcriptional regulator
MKRINIPELQNLLKQGKTQSECALILGVSKAAVSRCINERPQNFKVDCEELEKMLMAGRSQKECACRFGVSESAISQCVKKWGIYNYSPQCENFIVENKETNSLDIYLKISINKHNKIPLADIMAITMKDFMEWRKKNESH